jgi:cytochrome b561
MIRTTSTAVAYSRTAVALHWILALLLLGQIAFGWYLQDIPRGTPDRTVFVNFHKSIGMTLGLLILFRVYWRVTHRAPELPVSQPSWERAAASVSHWVLYACMLIMPLSGYIASNFSKWGVNFFNKVKLPPWGVESEAIYNALNTTHVVTSCIFVTLIAIHVLAAVRHLVLRDGIFSRMGWTRAGSRHSLFIPTSSNRP